MEHAERIIEALHLEPLPQEGGFYRRVYTHARKVPVKRPARPNGMAAPEPNERALSSAIYFLLTPHEFSALHRLPSDEMFHFYRGDPVEMVQIRDDGSGERITLGPDLLGGHQPMAVAPGGIWQGTRLLPDGDYGYALLGVSVHPGFDWCDLEMADRTTLTQAYPQWRTDIERLTRS